MNYLFAFILANLNYSAAAQNIAVIWTQQSLEPRNILVFQNFREEFANVHFVHFLETEIFDMASRSDRSKLLSVVNFHDEIGLYLKPTLSLLQASQVSPINAPNFWSFADLKDTCNIKDCDGDIPLTLYRGEDILKILKFAKNHLEKNLSNPVTSFMVHGQLSNMEITDNSRAVGLLRNYSYSDPKYWTSMLGRYPLLSWIEESFSTKQPNDFETIPMEGVSALKLDDLKGRNTKLLINAETLWDERGRINFLTKEFLLRQ